MSCFPAGKRIQLATISEAHTTLFHRCIFRFAICKTLQHKLCTAIVSRSLHLFRSRIHDWIISCIFLSRCHHFDCLKSRGRVAACFFAGFVIASTFGLCGQAVHEVASLTKANYYRMTMQKFMIASNNSFSLFPHFRPI